MSDIEVVTQWDWNNRNTVDRVPAGSIPIGDYEQDAGIDRLSFESFRKDAEPYVDWRGISDLPDVVEAEPVVVPVAKKRGRPRKKVVSDG